MELHNNYAIRDCSINRVSLKNLMSRGGYINEYRTLFIDVFLHFGMLG